MIVDWTPQIAEDQAGLEGIPLEEKHWCVIASVRELMARNGRVPSLAQVGAMCGIPVAEVKALFPGVVEEILARLAGAPEFERKEP